MFPRNFKIFAVTLLLVLGIGALISSPKGVLGAPVVPQEPCPPTNPNCNNTGGGNKTTRPQSAVVTVATNTSLYASTVTRTIKFYNPNSTIQPYWIYRSENYFSKSNATLVGSGSINPYQQNANMIVSFSDTVANAGQTEAYGIYLGPTTNLSSVKVVNFNLSTGTGPTGPTINNPNYAPKNQVGNFLDIGSTTQVKSGTLSIANSSLSSIGISLLPSGAVDLIDPLSYNPKGGMYYDNGRKNFYITATTDSVSGSPEWGCGMSFDSAGNIDITSAVGQWVQVGTQSYVGNNAFGGGCPAFGDTKYVSQYSASCTYYNFDGSNNGPGSCSVCSAPYKASYAYNSQYVPGCYTTSNSVATSYTVYKWEPTGTVLSVPGGSALTVNGIQVPMRGTWCGFVTQYPPIVQNLTNPPLTSASMPCQGILPSNGCPAGYEHEQWGYAGNVVDTCFKK